MLAGTAVRKACVAHSAALPSATGEQAWRVLELRELVSLPGGPGHDGQGNRPVGDYPHLAFVTWLAGTVTFVATEPSGLQYCVLASRRPVHSGIDRAVPAFPGRTQTWVRSDGSKTGWISTSNPARSAGARNTKSSRVLANIEEY